MHSRVSLRQLALVFAKIGTLGFGGGVGMLALIRQEIIEKRRWIDDTELSTAVAMGQMLPGPFVSNYAEYIGYRLAGLKGMVVSVVSLLLPGFLLMLILGYSYFRFGNLPLIQRLFSGIQPVVAGILAWATWSIGRANIRTVRTGIIALIAGIALFLRGDVLLVIIGGGLLGLLFFQKPAPTSSSRIWGSGILPLLPLTTRTKIQPLLRAGELALVFFKMGTVIFGGGFAAIPFLQHEVVELRGWLTSQEFVNAVALGQLTPGPVAIMATFIGYRVLGIPGALIATIGTFLPSGLMLLGLIRGYEKIRSSPLVQAFLAGVLPAVVGMLAVSTVFVARSAVHGLAPALVAILSLLLLLRYRIEPVWLIAGGALLGLVLP
ncbi:MAG: chromate efflux transporter [bacterium]